MTMKHIIWTTFMTPDDYKDFLEKHYPDATEEQKREIVYDKVQQWFDDEFANMNQKLYGRILVLADLGLRNGRGKSYQILEGEFSTVNLNSVFSVVCGYGQEFYSNGANLCCDDYHHDGVNHYEFRLIQGDKDIEVLLNKFLDGQATKEDINRYTMSLIPYINKV